MKQILKNNSKIKIKRNFIILKRFNGPTLRANPFPKVTDLFCRIPLPTLFYRLEAIHLEDLLRLSVRSNFLYLQIQVSRIVRHTPDHNTLHINCFSTTRPQLFIKNRGVLPTV